ncbi:MAG: rhomboid family intramembrane serine protease [Bryobacteraceae bacterium]|nr:rhomboid family intramembrane serine protease [Bryobacteraceae bacterium]
MVIPIHDSQRSYSAPLVVVGLIVVNVLAFLFELSLDTFTRNDFIAVFGLVPERFNWMSVFTSMFLHGGWMHLLGNMLFLWVYGDNVEDILGHGKFLLFYFSCGVAAALAQYAMAPDSRIPMVGASGAIAGVMGAYMVKFPHSRIVLAGWFIILFTFDLPAYVVLLYWFAIQFISGLGGVAQIANRGGVAFFAHIGGFLAGVLLIMLFKTRERYRLRRDLYW